MSRSALGARRRGASAAMWVVAGLAVGLCGCHEAHELRPLPPRSDGGGVPVCDPENDRRSCEGLSLLSSELGGPAWPVDEVACLCSPPCEAATDCTTAAGPGAECLSGSIRFCALPCASDAECYAGQACVQWGFPWRTICMFTGE